MVQEYDLTVSKIVQETHDCKTLRFSFEPGTVFSFKPGQYMICYFERFQSGKAWLNRSYSISSTPFNTEFVEITFRKEGRFTGLLWDLKEGDHMLAKGPVGSFVLEPEEKRDVVFIAGGTGIAPLMGMLRYAITAGMKNRITVLYSCKTPADIIYRNELEDIPLHHPNCECVVTITRPEGHSWQGHTGRIDDHLLKSHIRDLKNTVFYLCGPKAMIEDTQKKLLTLGALPLSIKIEKWG